jgi:hypothetical protein
MTKIVEIERENGCIECVSHRAVNGNPLTILEDGKRIKYSELKWKMEKGEIPADMSISYLCGNPNCGNPDHMTLITKKEKYNFFSRNGIDFYIGKSNLTPEIIRYIYVAPAEMSNKDVSQDVFFKFERRIKTDTISGIRKGKRFVEMTQDLESPILGKGIRSEMSTGKSKKKFRITVDQLTPEQIEKIKVEDAVINHFTSKFNVSKKTIKAIRSGKYSVSL